MLVKMGLNYTSATFAVDPLVGDTEEDGLGPCLSLTCTDVSTFSLHPNKVFSNGGWQHRELPLYTPMASGQGS